MLHTPHANHPEPFWIGGGGPCWPPYAGFSFSFQTDPCVRRPVNVGTTTSKLKPCLCLHCNCILRHFQYYFRYLFKAYPDALVIHQHRANVSEWYNSRLNHVAGTKARPNGFGNQGLGWDVPLLNIIDPPHCARNAGRSRKRRRRGASVGLVRQLDLFLEPGFNFSKYLPPHSTVTAPCPLLSACSDNSITRIRVASVAPHYYYYFPFAFTMSHPGQRRR